MDETVPTIAFVLPITFLSCFPRELPKRSMKVFDDRARLETPRRRNPTGTRILYFWILPERALSFPLNKGNEGSEKEMERQGRVKPLREIFLKHLFHEIAKRLNQLT